MVTTGNQNYERCVCPETCEVCLVEIEHKDMIPNDLLFSIFFHL